MDKEMRTSDAESRSQLTINNKEKHAYLKIEPMMMDENADQGEEPVSSEPITSTSESNYKRHLAWEGNDAVQTNEDSKSDA